MKRHVDLDVRKCVHIKLLTETHATIRIELLKRKLSLQEVFEEFAQRVVTGDIAATRMLDDIEERKRNKALSQLSQTDAETLLDAIEDLGKLK